MQPSFSGFAGTKPKPRAQVQIGTPALTRAATRDGFQRLCSGEASHCIPLQVKAPFSCWFANHCQALAEGLRHNGSLKRLDLRSNSIGSTGSKAGSNAGNNMGKGSWTVGGLPGLYPGPPTLGDPNVAGCAILPLLQKVHESLLGCSCASGDCEMLERQ